MKTESVSPWYNRNGWLGVKHQVPYLLEDAECATSGVSRLGIKPSQDVLLVVCLPYTEQVRCKMSSWKAGESKDPAGPVAVFPGELYRDVKVSDGGQRCPCSPCVWSPFPCQCSSLSPGPAPVADHLPPQPARPHCLTWKGDHPWGKWRQQEQDCCCWKLCILQWAYFVAGKADFIRCGCTPGCV